MISASDSLHEIIQCMTALSVLRYKIVSLGHLNYSYGLCQLILICYNSQRFPITLNVQKSHDNNKNNNNDLIKRKVKCSILLEF